MRRSRIVFLLLLLHLSLPAAADGRLSTFLQGTLVRKTADEWILATEDGTYWIDVKRAPSWTRFRPGGQVSFWIQVQQIRKMRPNVLKLIEDESGTAIAQK